MTSFTAQIHALGAAAHLTALKPTRNHPNRTAFFGAKVNSSSYVPLGLKLKSKHRSGRRGSALRVVAEKVVGIDLGTTNSAYMESGAVDLGFSKWFDKLSKPGIYSYWSKEGSNLSWRYKHTVQIVENLLLMLKLKLIHTSNVSTKVTYDVVPGTKAAISFNVPDHKSGKLGVHYLHHHAAINSSIGLNPSPLLEVAAAIGSKDIAISGEIGFDTSSSSFTKYIAGLSINTQDLSVALLVTDKGQTVKASFAHVVNALTGTKVAAEMTHRLSSFQNSFSFGSVHKIDPHKLQSLLDGPFE